MKNFLRTKCSLALTLVLMAASALAGWGLHGTIAGDAAAPEKAESTSIESRYAEAVEDAMTIDADEVQPLVSLAPDAPFATHNEAGRVLLLTYHNTPSSYPEGTTQTLDGDVWLVAPGEMADWVEKNGANVSDWPMRLQELLGLAPGDACSHFTAMWVNPDDVVRPANVQDTGDIDMTTTLAEDTTPDFKEWFDSNIVWSYFDSAYPWTRLGYTYDWSADADDEYGLSEFLVPSGANVDIAYTVTTDAMLDRFANHSWNPLQ